ncbi:DUF6470 family protein [Lentibacillus saliphilus]|uniref:DUF6470 family protein n=1 Tax=Lentibacillus saliphilus TaxID=2737028 RepID=UPI001C302316|nr:DUF6470 family protein [Lentibacillus saliphilus]
MEMPQIRMQSQMGRIAIHQTKGVQRIEQPRADLSIEQPKANLTIRTDKGKLTIDQTKAWADMNLMNITERNTQHAREGLQAAIEGAARRATQGRALMEIEHKGNPIIQQAGENSTRPHKKLGITFIPSAQSVEINYEPAQVEINAQANEPIINATMQKPIHDYEPGRVNIEMEQYPNLEIDFHIPKVN